MHHPLLIGTADVGAGIPLTFWIGADDSVYAINPDGSAFGRITAYYGNLLDTWEHPPYLALFPTVRPLLERLYDLCETLGEISTV